jgi:hypothetical protein
VQDRLWRRPSGNPQNFLMSVAIDRKTGRPTVQPLASSRHKLAGVRLCGVERGGNLVVPQVECLAQKEG